MPSARRSAELIDATGNGSIASSASLRRVMLPVCQCSSWRPVIRTNGYSLSGFSAAGMICAATSFARPLCVGKSSMNTTRWPGSPSCSHGYVTRALALEALPRDAGDRRHRQAHFVEHVARMRVVPVEPQLARHRDDDVEVAARITGQRQRLAPELHDAIGIGDRADLLRKRRCRQDHVGEIAGLGQEDVLHDEHLELGQRLARVLRRRGRTSRGSRP